MNRPSDNAASLLALDHFHVDRTAQYVGDHPFHVRVYAGPDRTRLFVAQSEEQPVQQMGMHGPGFGVIESLSRRAIQWTAVRAAMDRLFTAPSTTMLAVLATLPEADLFGKGLIRNFVKSDLDPLQSHQDWAVITATKAAMDEAGMVGPDFLAAAAVAFLVSPEAQAASTSIRLLDVVNRVLEPSGSATSMSGSPIARVSDVQALDLWFVKEGDLTAIFKAEVTLADHRRVVFVLNVAKDRRAAERHETVHHEMARLSRRDRRVMAPYQIGRVTVLPRVFHSMGLPRAEVTVSAGEWLSNFHELHLYPGDSRFCIWKDQRDTDATPISRGASDQLWREILQLHVQLARVGEPDFMPLWTHINAGDFVVRSQEDGSWMLKMIGTRGALLESTRPSPASYVASLLLCGAVDDLGPPERGARTIWWGNPEAAIRAVAEALETTGMPGRDIAALWMQIHDDVLPALIRSPRLHRGYDRLNADQQAECLQLMQVTRERLAAHLVTGTHPVE